MPFWEQEHAITIRLKPKLKNWYLLNITVIKLKCKWTL
jgi:hypothetical protein